MKKIIDIYLVKMNINLYNEIQKQRDKQNIIMQSSINDFY